VVAVKLLVIAVMAIAIVPPVIVAVVLSHLARRYGVEFRDDWGQR